MNKPNVAIPLLIAAHVIAGAVAGLFSAIVPGVSSATFISLIFCQASLVGMWGGFGHAHWALRLIGVAMGAIVLWIGLGLGLRVLEPESLLLLFVTTSVVALVTWGVRLVKAQLERASDDTANAREGLQFSIKHLMVLTFVVACLVTAGKLLAPYLSAIDMIAQIIVLGLCFVAVALASIWAMLGLRAPGPRIAPVLAIASASGWVGGFVIFRSSYTFLIAISVLEAVYLLASLAVIRMCGYRLVAHR